MTCDTLETFWILFGYFVCVNVYDMSVTTQHHMCQDTTHHYVSNICLRGSQTRKGILSFVNLAVTMKHLLGARYNLLISGGFWQRMLIYTVVSCFVLTDHSEMI